MISLTTSPFAFIFQASVSVTRINNFLNADELDPSSVSHDDRECKYPGKDFECEKTGSKLHHYWKENDTFSWLFKKTSKKIGTEIVFNHELYNIQRQEVLQHETFSLVPSKLT